MFATWFGGFGPGLLATMLAAVCGAYCFMPAAHAFTGQAWFDYFRLGVFVLEGVLISGLSARLRTTERRAAVSAGEASQYREASRQAAQTFRQLVENMHNHAVFMMDETGRINSWNVGRRTATKAPSKPTACAECYTLFIEEAGGRSHAG